LGWSGLRGRAIHGGPLGWLRWGRLVRWLFFAAAATVGIGYSRRRGRVSLRLKRPLKLLGELFHRLYRDRGHPDHRLYGDLGHPDRHGDLRGCPTRNDRANNHDRSRAHRDSRPNIPDARL